VFNKFLEWKALVEKSAGWQLKALCTDNGGEYVSADFKRYLRKEGVGHELTIPKIPEQNGVAEKDESHISQISEVHVEPCLATTQVLGRGLVNSSLPMKPKSNKSS